MLFFTIAGESIREEILERVRRIKNGDASEREKFIEDFRPFVVSQCKDTCGRFLDLNNGEELSVGLMAFNESIDSFKEEINNNFLPFAKVVIKRRLIDYLKKVNKFKNNEVCFTDLGDENIENGIIHVATNPTDVIDEVHRRKDMISFINELNNYNISIRDLVFHCPKHQDTRKITYKISVEIFKNPGLRNTLCLKRRLPIKELVDLTGYSRKTIDRHKKYIIALSTLLCGDYESLKEYIGFEGGASK
ncbi:MAG: RNA polymerase sigma-I factor [Bacillota bacterium]